MSKTLTQYVCQQCGVVQPKWAGRCQSCEAWNSLVEETTVQSRSAKSKGIKLETQILRTLKFSQTGRIKTGISDLDQVLGGGIVPGSVTLLSGDPGIGKSTLALQLAAAGDQSVLYVTGEESTGQIQLRASRLGLGNSDLHLLADNNIDNILATIEEGGYRLAVIDSIQTMATSSQNPNAGSVGQITACAQLIQAAAKQNNVATFLIGHVTKDGAIAGPKILEHLVDVVLYLEGERHGHFKSLRGIKNRYGSVSEVGIFEMTDRGLKSVANPSAALLAERQVVPGSVIFAAVEGTRPILLEAQALVAPSPYGYPKRTSAGFDLNRLNLLTAVLSRRMGLNLNSHDIFVNIVGGLKLTEPAADLAIILSIVSAFKNKPIKSKVVAFGEVGLSGEVRSVAGIVNRLAEANRQGIPNAVGPCHSSSLRGYRPVTTIKEAVAAAIESD